MLTSGVRPSNSAKPTHTGIEFQKQVQLDSGNTE
jgi:hypothetical protein